MRATMLGAIQVPFEDERDQAEFTGFRRRPQETKGRRLSAFETAHPKIEQFDGLYERGYTQTAGA